MADTEQKKTQVILVGVGGATCSGKTTLAKHLKEILPDSIVVHQDDFAPPLDLLPIHPVYQVQDWDSPAGAIFWDQFISFLHHIKKSGEVPSGHKSYDHFSEQKEIAVSDALQDSWKAEFEKINMDRAIEGGSRLVWVLVDGFLLYWHPDCSKNVIAELDIRIMLRVPQAVLKQRRLERGDYCTAEGVIWPDPPHYWEQIVYPGYIEAHSEAFVDGDVERGVPNGKIQGLLLLEALDITMGEAVDWCCRELKRVVLSETTARNHS